MRLHTHFKIHLWLLLIEDSLLMELKGKVGEKLKAPGRHGNQEHFRDHLEISENLTLGSEETLITQERKINLFKHFLQPFLLLPKGFACPTIAGIIIHLAVILLLPFIKGFEENQSWWRLLNCPSGMAQKSNNSVRFLQLSPVLWHWFPAITAINLSLTL